MLTKLQRHISDELETKNRHGKAPNGCFGTSALLVITPTGWTGLRFTESSKLAGERFGNSSLSQRDSRYR